MKPVLDETHDYRAQSWIDSADIPGTDFPIQNLPFGVFRRREGAKDARVGVAIGDRVLDLRGLQQKTLLKDLPLPAEVWDCGSLNSLMSQGAEVRRALRRALHHLLREDASVGTRQTVEGNLVAQADIDMLLPAQTGDYTDFYASIFHATNVGKLFRPNNPLLPNYKYVPIGYNGRASSLVASGTPVRRPCGQTCDGSTPPGYGPTRALDYELEVGFFVSVGNTLGEAIPINQAEEHIFGICLVNDWSARDIQSWEYQPLGPFLAKNFATSLSPWVVTVEALAPFRTTAFARGEGDPQPLPYLFDESDREYGGLDLWLEVSLRSAKMREMDIAPAVLGRSNFRDMYWTMAQMLAHHASNGCNLRTGDLLASGTVSGAEPTACGSLLELTLRGKDPYTLATGEQRSFLEDGDEVFLRGFCEREGFRRIGIGSCQGMVLEAV